MNANSELSQPVNRSAILVAAVSVGVFVILYFLNPYSTGYNFERVPLWAQMTEGYRRVDAEWGFGYAVLPAVLILLWISRDRYRDVKIKPSNAGLVIVLVALFFYYGGYKANRHFIGYGAGQLYVAGILVWFGGWDLFKRAFWLWILFGLVWPLTFLINPISFPLRKLMTVLTGAVLALIEGEENIVRHGTTIMSAPTGDLQAGDRFNLGVAAECSGLRSLFALGMVSLLYGYLALKESWQRFVLLISALPFAVLGNFVRMMLLYAGTLWWGSEFAIGSVDHPSAYHIMAGIMVFIVALFCMMATVTVLKGGLKALRRKKTRIRKVESEAT